MAQDATIKQFSNFSKGLMTEATPLNFPENYSLDEDNMLLAVDGSRERRTGMQFETGFAHTTTASANTAVSMKFFKWEFADDKSANTIGVVQVGQDLYFMDMESNAPSANLLNSGGALNLLTFMSTTSLTPKLSFSAINGVLLCTSSDFTRPIKISYATATDTISAVVQNVLVRDLWGVDDGQDVDEEATLTDTHEYNLLNQGWTGANITTWANPSPANSMVMHLGKDSTGAWTEATLRESFFGNSPAPKGKHILDFFQRGTDRAAVAGVGTVPADTETGMFSAVATNFGRVFWSGIESSITDGDAKSPNGSSLILYSQIIEREEQLGFCHTEADPTAEVISDQVDSDGGFIQIPELGRVIAMREMGNQIVLFADNGVWSIVSVDGQFTPTSYQVNKVTTVGISGADSIAEVEGTLTYWSQSGIYQMQLDDVTGLAKVADVTLQTIKTFYNNITKNAKINAKSYYDSITKQVGWLYQSDPNWDFDNFPDFCDKELIYDLQLQSFTVNTISSKTVQSPYVVGAVIGQSAVDTSTIDPVLVNGDAVCVNGEVVEQTVDATISTTSRLKYLTYTPSGTGFARFTLSNYGNEDYLDWDTEDYVSFLETGYIGFDDWARFKAVPYLICHFERTEDGFDADFNALHQSSCLVHARWDWTDSANANRWGTEFQAYRYLRNYVPTSVSDRFETGHRIITTKSKLRGKGKSLSLYFKSETGKNMKLYGFVLSAIGGTRV